MLQPNWSDVNYFMRIYIKKVNFFRHSVKEWSQKKLEKEKRSKGVEEERKETKGNEMNEMNYKRG